MKLWIDDVRPAPYGCLWATCTEDAIDFLSSYDIEVMSLDHDAGSEARLGGDFINVLKWLEWEVQINGRTDIPNIHIHTMNPVGAANMRAIINRNGWKEVHTI